MNPAAAYGKLYYLFAISIFIFISIVMEYSDNGDLFQKITNH